MYSSHCLEHMRDLRIAFTNCLRVCKEGGCLYICVPHEKYYEKEIWPFVNDHDHKHSFTVEEKSILPANVILWDFLSDFKDWIDVLDIQKNLMNYHFNWDPGIDQTQKFENRVCAQIDVIVRRKKIELSDEWRKKNNRDWFRDYWKIIFPIQIEMKIQKILPEPVKKFLKKLKGR